MPASARPCLKCGSRDHESGMCPKNQEHKSYMAQAMNFTAWCLGSDEIYSTTADPFGCENLAFGRVLLDCGATDTAGSVEANEVNLDKSHEAFRADHDWVSVDLCTSLVMPDGSKRCQSESGTGWTRGTPACACTRDRKSSRAVVCQVVVRAGSTGSTSR